MELLRSIWLFIQNQVLGMKWLNEVIRNGLTALGLDITTRWGGSVQFFLYDCIKIMVLLGVLILIISFIQSYFPPERTKRILGRFHGIGANCVAALLGTVTPFCSCSSIPLFIGFTSAGLPLVWNCTQNVSISVVRKNRKSIAAVSINPILNKENRHAKCKWLLKLLSIKEKYLN